MTTTSPTAPTWLTVSEVALRFHCSRDTIYRQIAQGAIPHVKLGQLVRVPARWVDQLETESLTPE